MILAIFSMNKKDNLYGKKKAIEFLGGKDQSKEQAESVISAFRSPYDGMKFIATIFQKGGPSTYSNTDLIQYLSKTNLSLIAEVEELAGRDRLTKLFNRDKLMEFLESNFARTKRHNEPMSFLLLDFDGFKEINDNYGHLVGDDVLRKSGAYIGSKCRKEDIPGRYGGEEFLIGMPQTPKHGGVKLADRLRSGLNALEIPNYDKMVTITVGISTYPEDGDNLRDLINKADSALYHGKDKGKNRIVPYEDGMQLKSRR